MREIDIERIVQEVLKCLQAETRPAAKKALLVYTGAGIGYNESINSLRILRQDGYDFDVFFSYGAKAALDETVVRHHLVPEKFLTDADVESPEGLVKDYDLVIVPTLTSNTAAKLACCITDTFATRMIMNALMTGKRVVLATDGCCPDHPARPLLGFRIPEPLKAQMRSNLEKLKSYGAVLSGAEKLDLAVTGQKPAAAEKQEPVKNAVVKSGKKAVIGKKQLEQCPAGGVLTVPHDSIVTALARDIAYEKNITIVKA